MWMASQAGMSYKSEYKTPNEGRMFMHWHSVVVYIASSFCSVVVNKLILSVYRFPSTFFLMFCHSTISLLFFCSKQFPLNNGAIACLLNAANMLLGVSASNRMNIAMFSALRRVSVLMTLVAQWYFSNKTFSFPVVASVNLMVVGSLLAVVHDKTFELEGYLLVTSNNVLTVASQMASKSALDNGIQKEGLIFYSEAVAAAVALVLSLPNLHSVLVFAHWSRLHFVVLFVLSTLLTLLLKYSTLWVLETNNPLTLAMSTSIQSGVMGLMVCLGLLDPTYQWSLFNFLGLQMSTVASLLYVWSDHHHSQVHVPVPERPKISDTSDPCKSCPNQT